MSLMGFSDEDNQVREVSYSDPLPVSSSYSGRLVTKTVTLTGAANLGQSGSPIPLFSVTGPVWMKLFATCSEDLVSGGGGTLEVGTVGNTAFLVAQTVATTIDNGEVWFNNSPIAGGTAASNLTEKLVVADVIGTVGTGDITDGTLKFWCFFQPLTSSSTVTAS